MVYLSWHQDARCLKQSTIKKQPYYCHAYANMQYSITAQWIENYFERGYSLNLLGIHHTLGFLPQIPFKMTQSIHLALQTIAILTENG